MRETIAAWVSDARQRTFELIADLNDEQLMGPRLAIVNPMRWEIGHLAWFQELWALRVAGGEQPVRLDGDALYDSSAIAHDLRWDLLLPTREETLAYLREIRDRVIDRLARGGGSARPRVRFDAPDPEERRDYFALLSIFHEDMHGEAFIYTRQTLSYPAPVLSRAGGASIERSWSGGGALAGDAEIPSGTFLFGSTEDEPFVFDNEKWAHPVEVQPFRIAKAAVTQAEFRGFVEDGGYRRSELWSEAGDRWREATGAKHPVYWRRAEDERGWLRRDFDRWVVLEPHRPVLHVAWYEAEAYCRWAKRRLPTELEWEVAAAGAPGPNGRLSSEKRRFPWGNDPPSAEHANLDASRMGAVDVGALPAGDSAFGLRQMIGNVWEWTSSDFLPFPGFVADPYKDYSEPWFGDHKVLRGGCWTTRARLLRNTWRNFYKPDRRDVWSGFRTCAR